MNKPLLSICLICYNQEAFILDALKGIAMQEVDFEYELIVADDCSTDGTMDCISDFLQKGFIKHFIILQQDKNTGAQKNWERALNAASGKYFAPVEGDDYWTDPGKLQWQVDFLEKNPSYAGCFHNVEERYESDDEPSYLYNKPGFNEPADWKLLCETNVMQTCSIVYRKLTDKLPAWIFTMRMIDWPLNIYYSQFGSFKYYPKVMAVHRRLTSSTWTPESISAVHGHIKFAYEQIIEGMRSNEKIHALLNVSYQNYCMAINGKNSSYLSKALQKIGSLIKSN